MQLTKIMITRFFFFFFVFRILFLRRRIFPFEEWLRVMNEEHWPGSVALATSREQARTSNKRMEYFLSMKLSPIYEYFNIISTQVYFFLYVYNNSIILYYNIIRLYLFMYQRYSKGWSMIYLYHSFQHWRSCSTRITIELWYFLSWMGNKI